MLLWFDDVRRDVSYAARGLARNPGFAIAAVVTLALGIGATTAVFSVVNAVLLRPLPYPDSDRLVRIVERLPARNADTPPGRRTGMTWTEFSEWRARTTTLSAMLYALTPPITLMPTAAGSARLTGALVSSNTFAMLGGRTVLGRTLDARDDAAGSSVVVLSAGAWRRYFQADPGIVGRTIALKTLGPEAGFLDGTPLSIVGVMDPSFDYPSPLIDFWTPISEGSPARRILAGGVIARVRDDVSIQAATDEANAIGEGLRPKPTSGPLSQPLPGACGASTPRRSKNSWSGRAGPRFACSPSRSASSCWSSARTSPTSCSREERRESARSRSASPSVPAADASSDS